MKWIDIVKESVLYVVKRWCYNEHFIIIIMNVFVFEWMSFDVLLCFVCV